MRCGSGQPLLQRHLHFDHRFGILPGRAVAPDAQLPADPRRQVVATGRGDGDEVALLKRDHHRQGEDRDGQHGAGKDVEQAPQGLPSGPTERAAAPWTKTRSSSAPSTATTDSEASSTTRTPKRLARRRRRRNVFDRMARGLSGMNRNRADRVSRQAEPVRVLRGSVIDRSMP